MEYRIIYSGRKTVGITVKYGEVIVRSARGISRKTIDEIVNKHTDWIKDKLEKQRIKKEKYESLTESDIKRLKTDAIVYFNRKCEHFSKIIGLKYSRIKITSAKKRFGSCSSSGVICFSYRLMLYPEAAREYVVVHELAHIKHLNHSKEFYALIERYMSDYKERRRLLK